jgi:hypothetical protein
MPTKHKIQTLLLALMIDEGKYNPDNYSQNIEIISPFYDSFTYLLKDPRLLLLSDVSKEQIKEHEFEINALSGRLGISGLVELSHDRYTAQELIYLKGIRDYCIPNYPFLDEKAAIIANYEWSVEGMAQIFTLLTNTSQDYYVGFGFKEDDPRALEKRIITEHFLEELRQESDYNYEDCYEKYKDTELYMISKKPKVIKKYMNYPKKNS